MRLIILALLMPFLAFSSQENEQKINATIWWVNDVLYIEGGGHLYYALDVKHSINCSHCCSDCVERIQDKLDLTAYEIINELNKGKHRNKKYLNFLYGKYEAYWECLHLIQHEGS